MSATRKRMKDSRGTTHLPSVEGWHIERVAHFGDYCILDRNEVVIADAIPLENLAQVIVREHNAHDALVEALEECIWVLEAIERGSLKSRTLAREQLTKAQAALRQAKGE